MPTNDIRDIAVVNGDLCPLAQAALAITDEGVTRGDGAFETMGVWNGRPFRRADHLERLDGSLRAALLPPVDPDALDVDIDRAIDAAIAGQSVDAALRIYVTASGTRVVTVVGQPPRPSLRRLEPLVAPWIRPVGTYALAGAKTMSYMPNMTLSRIAAAAGADDALLVSIDGVVLEGPTFGVIWVTEGRVRAPAVDLGIIDSVSRRTALEIAEAAGFDVEAGAWALDDVLAADEVMTSSAVRPLRALHRIGDTQLPGSTPVTDQLAAELERRRRAPAG